MINKIFALLCIYAVFNINTYADKYYINNNPLLLYKIINYWNISPDNDYNKPCGQNIKAELSNNIKTKYDPKKKVFTILIEDGFANLLSPFKESQKDKKFDTFISSWINPKYFNTINSTIKAKQNGKIEKIIFYDIKQKEIKYLKNVILTLDGTIYGIFSNSNKIALHNRGDFLKKCTNIKNSKAPFFTIKDRSTKEVLIRYRLK